MILGHKRQIEYLERARKNGKLAHAYLLYGPQRVGKLAVAKDFAEKLGAEITLVDREHTLVSKKDGRKDIPIEDIREIKRMWTLAPNGDAWRVLIVNDAEHMSDQAANAFLKLLEEPGGRTVIFLIASSRDLLMPTIISRTVPISFSSVPDMVLREYLQEIYSLRHPESRHVGMKDLLAYMSETEILLRQLADQNDPDRHKVDSLLALAAGRPGILLELLQDKNILAQEEELLRDLECCLTVGRAPEAFQLSARIAGDRSAVERLIAHLYGLLRKRLLGHIADGAIREYIGSIKHLDRVVFMLETSNAQTRLGLDALLLAMQKK